MSYALIIILTGNIGAGKSTIGKSLSKSYSLKYIDIINTYSVNESNLVNELFSKIMTNLLQGRGSILEFTGGKLWMNRLIKQCKSLNTNVFEFEIYAPIENVVIRIRERCGRQGKEIEEGFAKKYKEHIFNPNAIRIENCDKLSHLASNEIKRIINECIKN